MRQTPPRSTLERAAGGRGRVRGASQTWKRCRRSCTLQKRSAGRGGVKVASSQVWKVWCGQLRMWLNETPSPACAEAKLTVRQMDSLACAMLSARRGAEWQACARFAESAVQLCVSERKRPQVHLLFYCDTTIQQREIAVI